MPPSHSRTAYSAAGVAAWIAFALAPLYIRIAGFSRIHKFVRSRPVRRPRLRSDPAELIECVHTAARLSFVRVRCLERALVTTCVLRFFGHPAAFIIGVRRLPFYAHAWTELDGIVVTDPPEKIRDLVEMERC
jgi:hypothetical protein